MGRIKKGPNKMPPKLGNLVTVKKATKAYVQVLSTESEEKFKEIGALVNQKKLKWAYYTNENSIGTHYYLILKNQK
jgi:hypothetical protein